MTDTFVEILGPEANRQAARAEMLARQARHDELNAQNQVGTQPGLVWETYTNCEDIEPGLMMHPERYVGGVEAAKAVCRGCVAKEECLEEALGNPDKFGIWGGTTDEERRDIRQQRAKAAEIAASLDDGNAE